MTPEYKNCLHEHFSRYDTPDYYCKECGWTETWDREWETPNKKLKDTCFICGGKFIFNNTTCKENEAGKICAGCVMKVVK